LKGWYEVIVDNMTRIGHLVTMKKVKIAEFKSHLSAYLSQVRKGGEITVLDRKEPIARVIPFSSGESLQVRPPHIKGRWKELKPSLRRSDIDVVGLLREDRDSR